MTAVDLFFFILLKDVKDEPMDVKEEPEEDEEESAPLV